MANTFTNVNDTKIMADAIAALNHGLTMTDIFSIDVGSDPAEKNQTIYVPLATARTGAEYNTTYEDGNTTIAGQSVDVNTHLMCPWHVTEKQSAQSRVKLFEAGSVECAYGLAATVQNTIINVVTASNFGNTEDTDKETVTAANFDADAIADIKNICVKTNKWREVRPGLYGSLVMDGAYITNAQKDPAIRDKSASGKDALESGLVGKVSGFNLYENNIIASSTPGSGGENLVGFAVQPAAIAAAIRPIQPLGGAALEYEDIATDPDSGISMSYRRWVNTATGDMWGAFTVLMGVGKVDGNRLVRIVSA